jgi:DNA helicase-4
VAYSRKQFQANAREKMTKEWAPSWWGRLLTGSSDWRLHLRGPEIMLALLGRSHRVNVEDETSFSVQAGTFWTEVTFYPGQEREVKVDGLPNVQGATLTQALSVALIEKRLREDVAFLQGEQQKIDRWLDQKTGYEQTCAQQRRWFTHEMQEIVMAARPTILPAALRSRLIKPSVAMHLGPAANAIERSLVAWEGDHHTSWAALNAAHAERELQACKELLDQVESKPLTPEQAHAVVCFDNRVQVVASAGSGKTSVMVAKAAYAIHRGFVAPERILLLAFNKQAAEELKKRTAQAFERLGMENVTVEASTFHALGLRLIGKATTKKPDIPDWATDAAGGVRKLSEIVDQLKDSSPEFRRQWDLFRFVFRRDLPDFGKSDNFDAWDAQGEGALLTVRGERVKSQEEVMIANFLFLNGVDYRYEAHYPHPTADEEHRQYRPDFYYPTLGLFHEHFALDAQGVPPIHFKNYLEGVHWKRQLHAEKGTALFETTSHGLRRGDDFARLERELTARGVVLEPNPDREIPKGGQTPMESIELVGLIRTFMSHAKSNGLTISALQQRLDAMNMGAFKYRHQMFLNIAAPIMGAWDAALVAEHGIDFEDMLNQAAEHLESGRVKSNYELVMADEFQDASRARARLCRALVQQPGRFFFAVGDDWQSINRFAGADVSVMTGFGEWFGHGQVLKLERTFRCPQNLCDVAGAFVSKNPAQITKHVISTTPAHGPVLQAFQVDSKDMLISAIDQFVMRLADGVREGLIPPSRDGKVSVYVLGRYNADKQYVTANQRRVSRWVDVSFLTIHRSKGSEADYVILPEMLSVLKGRSFPNMRTDDPVLSLAMPDGDNFPLGEERRLFYVALTRARRAVAMFTAKGQCSTFLRELEEDGALIFTDTDGEAIKEKACPACKQGVLVPRTGPHGEFHSCSNFPFCRYKPRQHEVRPSPHSMQRIATRTTTAAISRPTPGPVSTLPTDKTPRLSLSSLLRAVDIGLTQFNHNVTRASALQGAVSDLKHQLFVERHTIDSALNMAKSAIELEEKMKDPVFKEAYQSASIEIADLHADSPNDKSLIDIPAPSFRRDQRHPDAEIEAAIQRVFDELREEREAFLSVKHSHLSEDQHLCRHFLSALEKLSGERYLLALDLPFSSTRGK